MTQAKNGVFSDHQNMEDRYRRAAQMVQGMYNNKVVLNDIVFPHWIAESDYFWYERRLRDGKQYRLVAAKNRTNAVAFDHRCMARLLAEAVGQKVNAEDLPIQNVEISISPLQVTFDAFERSWIFDSEDDVCQQVERIPKNWQVSPDGSHAVFSRDYNLWLRDLASGDERALTTNGREDFAYAVEGENYGATSDPWGDRVQARWAPDGSRLFTVLRDTREVQNFPVLHHVPLEDNVRPKVVNYKIALPGDIAVPEYHLLVIEIDGGKIQLANYPAIPALHNGRGYFNVGMGWWANDSRRSYFVDQSRDYQQIRVVEFDTFTGKTRVLFTETSETQLNLAQGIYEHPVCMPLPDTNELIWWSERTGWGHLYLYDLDTGALKQKITQGDWLVRQVVQVDLERRSLFVQTAGRVPNRDPYYQDLCEIHIDSGEIVDIATSNHEHLVLSKRALTVFFAKFLGFEVSDGTGISPTGDFVVVTRSRVDELPVSLLLDRQGGELLELEHADTSALPDGWRWPEPVALKAADGKTDLYGAVFRPSDFSPERSYPVLALGHHMPDVPMVPKGAFSNDYNFGGCFYNGLSAAELGFIVVIIDGRGTPCRDKGFQDAGYGCVFSACNMDDEVEGLRQLAERFPYMDLGRVGVICPTGGPGAVRGLLEYPDFYKVGVSMIQHDSRLMPCTMMGDKFEGLSGPSPVHHYPEHLVENLKGHLLLMHGMLDQGNPPAILFRVVDALERANKDVDMYLSPHGHHGTSNYILRRAWDYLVTHLLDETPPKHFRLEMLVDTNEVGLASDVKANEGH